MAFLEGRIRRTPGARTAWRRTMLMLFTTLASLGAPQDITLAEHRGSVDAAALALAAS